MRRILFILFFSVVTFAQTPAHAQIVFDFGNHKAKENSDSRKKSKIKEIPSDSVKSTSPKKKLLKEKGRKKTKEKVDREISALSDKAQDSTGLVKELLQTEPVKEGLEMIKPGTQLIENADNIKGMVKDGADIKDREFIENIIHEQGSENERELMKEYKAGEGMVKEGYQELQEIREYDKDKIKEKVKDEYEKLDEESLAEDHLVKKNLSEEQLKDYEQLRSGVDPKEQFIGSELKGLNNMNELDADQLKRIGQMKASKIAMQELHDNFPKIQEAQEQMLKLKQKYSWFSNGKGTKINSLAGEKFHKRLTWGGTLRLSVQPSPSLDVDPFLGYRINKRVTTGLNLSYKLLMDPVRLGDMRFDQQQTSYRGYVEYFVKNKYFVRGELENYLQKHFHKEKEIGDAPVYWIDKVNIGIGRQMKLVKKTHMTYTILYTVLDQNEIAFERNRLQVRVGFGR